MEERAVYWILGIVLFCAQQVSASIQCGNIITHICYGSGAYCCRQSNGSIGCCWETNIYQLWWFWLIWIVVFFLILACSLACWRRRRARYRYMVMSNSEYPGYGTVVQTNTVSPGYNAPPGYNPSYTPAPTGYSNAPVAPPSYETAQATKPPAYST